MSFRQFVHASISWRVSPTWVNWHTHVLDVFLGLGRYDLARKYIRKHRSILSTKSARCVYTMTSLLLMWEAKGPNCKPPRVQHRRPPSRELSELLFNLYSFKCGGPNLDEVCALSFLLGMPGHDNPSAEKEKSVIQSRQGTRDQTLGWAR